MNKSELLKKVLYVVLVISLVPILVMGFYARPLWDDYAYSSIIKTVSKVNPLLVILAPFANMIGSYFTWQGTYSSEFIFTLQPGAWPFPAYWLTPIIIILPIVVGYIYFWRVVCEKLLKCNSVYGTIMALMLLILQFQYVPFIHQTYYWYVGAVYYSFYLGIQMIEWGLLIRLFQEENVSKKLYRWTVFLIFFVQGSNYSTALINFMVPVLMAVYAYFTKKEKFKLMKKLAIFATIGLVINVAAPGNWVRASSDANPMNPVKAILMSFVYCYRTIRMWINIPVLGLIICLIPVAYMMVRKSQCKFRFPLIAIFFMIGIHSAQMTPPLCILSGIGDTRQQAMLYFSLYILMAGSIVYFVGWINVKFGDKLSAVDKFCPHVFVIGLCVIVIGIYADGINTSNDYKICEDIFTGHAAEYARQYDSIVEQLQGEDKVCYVKDIDQQTNSLDKFNFREDPEYWVNQGMANYFGKEKVISDTRK